MKDSVDTLERPVERSQVAEVALDALGGQGLERAQLARRSHEHADALAAGGQLSRDVAAHKARGSRDQRGHRTRKLPSAATRSVCAARLPSAAPPGPPLRPLPGPFARANLFVPWAPPMRPESCHLSIFQLSPSLRCAPSTAEGS